jgi:hypothetical protein
MRRKVTILFILASLFVLLFASIPVSAGPPGPEWTKDLGDVWFRNGKTSSSILSQTSGYLSDIYYHTGWMYEERTYHSQWTFFDTVKTWFYPSEHAQGVERSLTATGVIPADEQREPEEELFWIGVRYGTTHGAGIRNLYTKAYTSDEREPNGDGHLTVITVSSGQSGTWNLSIACDFDDNSESTIEAVFSDGDTEENDMPDAGNTTVVYTDNDHELEYTVDEDNEILYIKISEADTVDCAITVTIA